MKEFFKRQFVVPFEVTFGIYSVYGGLMGIVGFGQVNTFVRQEFGDTLTTICNALYVVAGLAIFFGIGLNKRNIEASGLVLLIASLVVRAIALEKLIDWWTPQMPALIGNYVYSAIFIVACILRVRFLFLIRTLVVSESVAAPK